MSSVVLEFETILFWHRLRVCYSDFVFHGRGMMIKKKKKTTKKKVTKKKVAKKKSTKATSPPRRRGKGKPKEVDILDAAVMATNEIDAAAKRPLSVLPKSVMMRKGGDFARTPRVESLTMRLREIMRMPANQLQETIQYCEKENINAATSTVFDCVVHAQIAQTLRGSSTHAADLWNRIDGRPVQKNEIDVRAMVAQHIVLMDDIELPLDVRKKLLKAVRDSKKMRGDKVG